MIGWLNDINRLVSKDKREHHESSQQKTSSGLALRPATRLPAPARPCPPRHLGPPRCVWGRAPEGQPHSPLGSPLRDLASPLGSLLRHSAPALGSHLRDPLGSSSQAHLPGSSWELHLPAPVRCWERPGGQQLTLK